MRIYIGYQLSENMAEAENEWHMTSLAIFGLHLLCNCIPKIQATPIIMLKVCSGRKQCTIPYVTQTRLLVLDMAMESM